MSSSTRAPVTSSPYTQAVFAAIRRLYPEHLADKSFDNTGVLIEAPYSPSKPPDQQQANSVLLAIDLTAAVADEAIQRRDSVVIAYHPTIFFGLKSLTLANSQQRSLLRLAAEGISVYSPHTSVDASKGGNGDWLADVVTGKFSLRTEGMSAVDVGSFGTRGEETSNEYKIYEYGQPTEAQHAEGLPHTRTVIEPNATDSDAGIGRIVELSESAPLSRLLSNIAAGVGNPAAFAVALPQGSKFEDVKIRKIGICAGSGGSVLRKQDVDLLLTGEMDHHSTLALIEQGRTVVTLNHSNSERGYLTGVMQPELSKAMEVVWKQDSQVDVSKVDRDPFSFAVRT